MSLEVDNLVKTFGARKALDSMAFTVQPGELYGFVGSNGAGKTTTMRIILGVLAQDSGAVRYNGQNLDFTTLRDFAYMPEERGLYPKMKVGEQLIYLARLQGLDHTAATKAMEYWTERLGIASRRGDEVQALSLGNQQRVQLSAALVHDPKVLILDEPFSGLDPLAVEDMSGALREKAEQGATVVFSSHQLDLVERLCDRVGIASLGRIVAEGTTDELRATEDTMIDVVSAAGPHALLASIGPLGATSEQVDDKTVRVTLQPGQSDQDLLRAALEAGPLHAFTPYRPHLTELFSHVVTLPQPDEEEKPARKGFAKLFGGKDS